MRENEVRFGLDKWSYKKIRGFRDFFCAWISSAWISFVFVFFGFSKLIQDQWIQSNFNQNAYTDGTWISWIGGGVSSWLAVVESSLKKKWFSDSWVSFCGSTGSRCSRTRRRTAFGRPEIGGRASEEEWDLILREKRRKIVPESRFHRALRCRRPGTQFAFSGCWTNLREREIRN